MDTAGAALDCQTNLPRRILVVDDDPWFRHLNSDILALHGFAVDVAENGAAAWDAIQLTKYDLLVTDNNMPELSGIQLVKKIFDAGIPLSAIMASGTVSTDELDRNQWFNIEAVLRKPYTTGMLLETVKNVLLMTGGTPDKFEMPPSWPVQPQFIFGK